MVLDTEAETWGQLATVITAGFCCAKDMPVINRANRYQTGVRVFLDRPKRDAQHGGGGVRKNNCFRDIFLSNQFYVNFCLNARNVRNCS